LPLFFAKKEVFQWLSTGQKTIDIRKGSPKPGEIAVFQSGSQILRLKIVKTECGQLTDILRLDNFKTIIPSAAVLEEAISYLRKIYNINERVFTAYYVAKLCVSEK
jgi:ASC-1-like (ASCH) protein